MVDVSLNVVFWWWSMHFLLNGRRTWRYLLPAALATALFWLGLRVFSTIFISEAMISNEKQYGSIGVVFILMAERGRRGDPARGGGRRRLARARLLAQRGAMRGFRMSEPPAREPEFVYRYDRPAHVPPKMVDAHPVGFLNRSREPISVYSRRREPLMSDRHSDTAPAISDKLTQLGSTPEACEISDEAVQAAESEAVAT